LSIVWRSISSRGAISINIASNDVTIENTTLYREMSRRLKDIPAGPPRLLDEFERLRILLQEHGKYIVLLFPEYTPHDHTRHLDHLFVLADRVLGKQVYKRLNSSE